MNVGGMLSHVINCCILSFNTGMLQWSYLEDVNGYWGIMNVAGMLLHLDNYSCKPPTCCMSLYHKYKHKSTISFYFSDASFLCYWLAMVLV